MPQDERQRIVQEISTVQFLDLGDCGFSRSDLPEALREDRRITIILKWTGPWGD